MGFREYLRRNRVRFFKSSCGLALLGVASWQGFRFFVQTWSSDAVVVSSFTTVAAPIDGYVQYDSLPVGVLVEKQAELAKITNPRVDRRSVAELKTRLDIVDAELEKLGGLTADLGKSEGKFRDQAHVYARRRAGLLSNDTARLRARVEADKARRDEAKARIERLEALASNGLASGQELDQVRRDYTVAQKDHEASQQDLANNLVALSSMQQGIVVDANSSADRSYSSQRADEVALRAAQMSAERASKERERSALAMELVAHEQHVRDVGDTSLFAAERSRIWGVLAADREFVHAGQPVLKLLDCTKLRVVAYVDEYRYRRLAVGDAAELRVSGSRHWFRGRISLLLGRGEGDWVEGRSRYAVVVGSEDFVHARSASCEVGQSADVKFIPTGRGSD